MNLKETYRYLGYRNEEPDDSVKMLVVECFQELERAAMPKSFYREYPLKFFEEDGIDAYGFQTHSRALRKNLTDCDRILYFAATLGAGVDQLLCRYGKLQMSKAVILQAASAAMLEDYCDEVNEQIRGEYEEKGLYLRPRFSPGYGDFPLECQPALTSCLEAGKRVGITLTDSFLMMPSKSVTAVIGVSTVPRTCTVKGCEACGKLDCSYRRG